MKLIKNIKIDGVRLKRLKSKPEEIITWEVISEDGYVRLAIIRQVYEPYLRNRLGYKEFRIKYWLASCFYPPNILVSMTRRSIINKVKINRYGK